jgi:alkanesulfonate monooxygenase SsuD/methylene tetrahydromethanopterin reductase-like flavin-dependent oxidoreductase (luciferase family)
VVKLGITLPSFRDEPTRALEVAAAAEAAGVDGVFLYDHLFRRGGTDGRRRPALELLAMMGAVAAETHRVAIGSLVARATLRPAAVLASGFDTALRIAGPGRVIAAVGAGDGESEEEMVTFGLEFGDVPSRVAALRDAVEVTRDRGYPVWVGGNDPAVREVAAAHADGWNKWGGSAHTFRVEADGLCAAAARDPFSVSWGGLVVLGATDAEATAKATRLSPSAGAIIGGPEQVADGLRAYADAGAAWIIAGPVDSADPENASMLGELVAPLLV